MKTAIVLCVCLVFLGSAFGSSHSEAPGTSKMPQADNVDFYMFKSYESGRSGYTTFLMNFQPLQNPFGGPNYFSFSDQFFYILNIDWDGDSVADKQIEIYFGQSLGGESYEEDFESDFCDCVINAPTEKETLHRGYTEDILDQDGNPTGNSTPIALKFAGPISSSDDADLNWFEYYQINTVEAGVRTPRANLNDNGNFEFTKPFDYAGEKTLGDSETYENYARSFIHSFDMGSCSTNNAKVFVGQRRESFNVNLGPIFDLVNFVPIEGFIDQNDVNNNLRWLNVGTIAIEVPTECIVDTDPIIGAWATVNQLCHDFSDHVPGDQVSRLGMPLVNELVIGLAEKKDFNTGTPSGDGQFLRFVEYPAFPAILNRLFRTAVNSVLGTEFGNIAPFNLPRADLVATFLTGIAGVNQPNNVVASEMLRLNTGIDAVSASAQISLGVIGGDNAGFPNGRRPGDDTVDIVLRVAMGKLCDLGITCTADQAPVGAIPFTDGAPINATYFDEVFPYLKVPLPGSPYPGFPVECEECPFCPIAGDDDDDDDSPANTIALSFCTFFGAALAYLALF